MTDDATPLNLVAITADIVAEYAANNQLPGADLPGLIQTVHAAFAGLGAAPADAPAQPTYTPAVSVRKSLADPAFILSMIDGKPYKVLTRHLGTHGLTPAEYRERYGLSADYPLTAPAYSERRSALATQIGLGKGGRKTAPKAKPAGARPRGRPKLKPTYT